MARTLPVVLSPCLYQITLSPGLTSTAGRTPPARRILNHHRADVRRVSTHLVQMSIKQPPSLLLEGGGEISCQNSGPLNGDFLSDLLVSGKFVCHPPLCQTHTRGSCGPNVWLQWVMQTNQSFVSKKIEINNKLDFLWGEISTSDTEIYSQHLHFRKEKLYFSFWWFFELNPSLETGENYISIFY